MTEGELSGALRVFIENGNWRLLEKEKIEHKLSFVPPNKTLRDLLL